MTSKVTIVYSPKLAQLQPGLYSTCKVFIVAFGVFYVFIDKTALLCVCRVSLKTPPIRAGQAAKVGAPLKSISGCSETVGTVTEGVL